MRNNKIIDVKQDNTIALSDDGNVQIAQNQTGSEVSS